MNRVTIQKEMVLKGLPLSEGYAVARVCLFNERRHSNLPVYRVQMDGVNGEVDRLKRAIVIVGERLESVRQQVEAQVGKAEAEIFTAQRMILDDPALAGAITSLISVDKLNAETAVARVLEEYESRLLVLDNEYIKERASDLGEIKRRLLDVFSNMRPDLQCGAEEHCQRGKNRIVVAEEMTPMLTTGLDTPHLMALLTERGGYNSHGAILARSLGIPAVSGLHGIRNAIGCGTEILVNGTTGDVVIWPTEETVARVATAQPNAMRLPVPVDPVPELKVMANIRMTDDVREAVRMKAEGIGLYRTEVELIQAGRRLTEQELFERYLAVFEAMPGHAVMFRMFDLGSDKKPPFLHMPDEDNPSLGLRGARLLLGSGELLRTQARALARVSQRGPLHVMYPMVVDVEQFRKLKAAFMDAVADIPHGAIAHGAMLEVPSVCLQAEELFAEADFGSIGSNDLLQYLFAVDRDNELVAADYTYDKPVFWQLIANVVRAADGAGKPVSICGEMAGDPRLIPRLMKAGIRSISVSTRRIPVARTAVLAMRSEREEIR